MYHTGNQLVDPYLLFQKGHLQEGMQVADFGCGRTGHMCFPAAHILGERGVVYAVDIMKEVLQVVEKRAKSEGHVNVHPVWSNIEFHGKTAIPPGTLDIVFIVNTLSQCHNRHGVLEEASRLLKPKGRIVVADWSEEGPGFGPKRPAFVDFRDIRTWGSMKGFTMQDEFTVGKYHYGCVLYRNA